jgi:hypothetical protein
MAMTAIGGDFGQPPDSAGCWCCGERTVTASLLRLGEHPEVGVCFRCVCVLARRKRELERQTRAALVQITSAECGCIVDRSVILVGCELLPSCCCQDLFVSESEKSWSWRVPAAARSARSSPFSLAMTFSFAAPASSGWPASWA